MNPELNAADAFVAAFLPGTEGGGVADVLIDTPSGQIQVAEMKKNDFLGEIAILCDVPRTATVTANQHTVALRINKDTFFRLVTEFPQMSVEIMRELARRLDKTNEQLRQAVAKAGA